MSKKSYNERLFEGRGIRSYLHNSRFVWAGNKMSELNIKEFSMLEVGCFDGRLLTFCPTLPTFYLGLDADWEGGLTDARSKFVGEDSMLFVKTDNPLEISKYDDDHFDITAALETMEHILPKDVPDYIFEISRATKTAFIVTVPNERGLVFLFKYLVKKITFQNNQRYKLKEVFFASLGMMSRVARDDHKGFDFYALIEQLKERFDVACVENVPFRRFPLAMAFTIGIVCLPKQNT